MTQLDADEVDLNVDKVTEVEEARSRRRKKEVEEEEDFTRVSGPLRKNIQKKFYDYFILINYLQKLRQGNVYPILYLFF